MSELAAGDRLLLRAHRPIASLRTLPRYLLAPHRNAGMPVLNRALIAP
jgi:hypothetical protein